jgi:K+-sensing histidine kinase KdpD
VGKVGSITPLPVGREGSPEPARQPSVRRFLGLTFDGWILVAAVAAPIAMVGLLVPWRDQLDAADGALFLVVVIVAIASTGRRLAAALAAVVSALAFDYFLTVPYESFRITNHQDLISEILLIVVGLAVGELAARGRRHRDAASTSSQHVAQLHAVTELTATGRDAALVVATATTELRELLNLRGSRFTRGDPGAATARITPAGDVVVGSETWSTEALGLPTRSVDLPVRSSGWLLGHFILTPTPGTPVSSEALRVAVAIADQVGAALAAEEQRPTSGGPETPGPAPLPDSG